jgi:hypothetical protein
VDYASGHNFNSSMVKALLVKNLRKNGYFSDEIKEVTRNG